MPSVTQVKIENVTPAKLVQQVRRGRIRLPAFQRDYRWHPGDVESLFDSVLRRYPIGNLLLWQRPADAGRIATGPLVLDVPAVPDARWVVDGQQRITSLVGALTAPAGTTDPRFNVHMNLRDRRFRATIRRPKGPWLPVSAALSTQSLLTWQRDNVELLSEADYDAADDLAAAIQEYPVPSYVVEAEDEREVRVVFDRMNNFGRPLRKEEIFDALHGLQGTARPGDLGAVAAAVAAAGFGQLADRDVLRSLLAIRGANIFRDVRPEFDDDDDRREAYASTERVLLDVIAMIREDVGVPHVDLMPYPSVLPLLAALVHKFERPRGRAAVLVRRWIWRGGALGANPAGSPPQVRRALRELDGAASVDDAVRALLDRLPPAPTIWTPDLTQVALNRALPRINVLGMLRSEPVELLPAEQELPVPNPALAPSELFESGTTPLMRIVPGRRSDDPILDTMANRLVHPPMDVDPVAALLAGSDDARASHAVDATCTRLLVEARWEEALRHRAQVLEGQIARTVGDGAEWGARDRPTAAELIGTLGA